MTDTSAEFAARIARWEAKKIRENPSNHNEVTVAFEKRYGWGDYEPWCAEGVTIIGTEGGVLPASCASAGAWDLTSRMQKQGLGRTLVTVHLPGVISFNYGKGHVGFLLGLSLDKLWGWTFECNTGSGNAGSQQDGDGAYFRKRYLGGGAVHAVCDLVYAPNHQGATNGKPVDRYLRLTTPLMSGQDVLNVKNALNRLGNHLDVTHAVYDQTMANTVNLFNSRHQLTGPDGHPARGVTAATWALLRKLAPPR